MRYWRKCADSYLPFVLESCFLNILTFRNMGLLPDRNGWIGNLNSVLGVLQADFYDFAQKSGTFPEGDAKNPRPSEEVAQFRTEMPELPVSASHCMPFLTIFGEKPAFSWTASPTRPPSSLKKALFERKSSKNGGKGPWKHAWGSQSGRLLHITRVTRVCSNRITPTIYHTMKKTKLTYTSPTAEVLEMSAQGVLCQSGTINGLNPREDDTDFWG